METKIMIIPVDFDLDNVCTSPYISAPSSPQHFGTLSIPSRCLERSGETNRDTNLDDDFAFEFSGSHELENGWILSAADELFDGGKLKPVNLPVDSPDKLREATFNKNNKASAQGNDGRIRHTKGTRSLSPTRASGLLLFDYDENIKTSSADNDCYHSSSLSSTSSFWYKKWNLKDLLLFRSASESRATSRKEELNKYELLKKARQEYVIKNASISIERSSESSSRRRRSRQISAHELHYKMKREMLKELKKKTFLPYRQGLLGCSSLDSVVSDAISTSMRSQ